MTRNEREFKLGKTQIYTVRTLRLWIVPQLLDATADEMQEMLKADGSGVLRSFMGASFWKRFGSYLKNCAAVFYRAFLKNGKDDKSEIFKIFKNNVFPFFSHIYALSKSKLSRWADDLVFWKK